MKRYRNFILRAVNLLLVAVLFAAVIALRHFGL